MDLDFSEEQLALRDMVRGLCAEYSSVETVRELEDDPKGYPDGLWKQLGELGLLGLLIPEAQGGAGQGLLEAVIVHEELGAALAPSPAFESGVVSALTVMKSGTDAQKGEWLPKIASGEAILTPAWLEPQSGFGPKGIAAEATKKGDGWQISGVKRHVTFASEAARLIVLARTGGGLEEIGLFLVDPKGSGVSLSQAKSLASDTQYDVAMDGCAAELLGTTGAEGWQVWKAVMLDAIIVQAARANGGCERALDMTVQYAKDRKQFDKPIGAFQSISHYLADALTHLDGSKTLVYEAAWTREQGRDVARLAPMAKLFACETFRDTTAMCQQVWGGVGFTIEYDIQLFFRRAKQLQITWYDTRILEEMIAAQILD